MTAAELQDTLKRLMGSAGSVLTTEQLQSAIDSALDDMARLKPKVGYTLVTLVPDRQEYSVPSNTYNVLDAIFSDPFGYTEETRWFQEFASIGDGELSTFHSHSLAVIIAQKWEQLSSQYSYEWEYNLDTGQVLVLPAPQVEGKMVLKIAYKRELKEMPTSLEQPLQDLALAECLQLTAVSSSDGIMSLPIGIGNVTFDNTKLLARADILRKRGLQKLGVHSGEGVVIIG